MNSLLNLKKRRAIELGQMEAWLTQGLDARILRHDRILRPLLQSFLRMAGLLERGNKNARVPVVRTLHLTFDELPRTFNGFRILHISDLHIDGNPSLVAPLAELLSQVDVDLCVLTGDFRFATYGPCENIYPLLKKLLLSIRSRHGVVGVLGNHDWAEQIQPLEELGIRMLMNSGFGIHLEGKELWVSGVDDPHYYRTDDIHAALSGSSDSSFKILLAHSPDIYKEAADAGVNLYLCGHTHGGQICLPKLPRPLLLNARCSRQFAKGGWKYGQMRGYTTAGAGTSLLDVRFHCPAEVALIELLSSEHNIVAHQFQPKTT